MNVGFLAKPPGCCLAPIWIPLAIPFLLVCFSLKVLAFVLDDANVIKSDRAKPQSFRGRRVKSNRRKANPFDNLRPRRSKPPQRNPKRHAQQLLSEINEALDYNRRISIDKKSSVREQARQMAGYAVASSEKLARIRRRKTIVSSERQIELERLERRLSAGIIRSLDMLEDALVAIIKVDVVGGQATIDRLVTDMNESNARLRDVADAHDEIRTVREAWVGELD